MTLPDIRPFWWHDECEVCAEIPIVVHIPPQRIPKCCRYYCAAHEPRLPIEECPFLPFVHALENGWLARSIRFAGKLLGAKWTRRSLC